MKLLKTHTLAVKCPELIDEWYTTKNGALTPEQVYYGSDKRVWWKCRQCSNKWETTIRYRSIRKRGCPECGKIKKLESYKRNKLNKGNLADNYPEIAKEWHTTKNKTLTPDQVYYASTEKVCWKCSFFNIFKHIFYIIVFESNNFGHML